MTTLNSSRSTLSSRLDEPHEPHEHFGALRDPSSDKKAEATTTLNSWRPAIEWAARVFAIGYTARDFSSDIKRKMQ